MQARIEEDLKAAMKSGDKRRVSTLRLLLSVLKNEKIKSQRELTTEEAEAVIRRAAKQRKESIEVYDRTGRADLAAAEKEELGILEAYLPQAMSDAELEETVRSIISEKGFSSARDVGQLMKELMARHHGRVDGKRAQEIARKLLP
ncbi:MAG TPA: GatB/YqeY domain-containing protein [Thermoanaerobaculia bacterium]|nr:GatB/YqeY domain-containing protein [Thermoanaerobaculia bacterium]